MTLENAIDVAQQMRKALQGAVEAARSERSVLRVLDAPALLRRAAARDAFNVYTSHLSERLAAALESAARELGVTEVRLDTLAQRAPEPTARFSALLADIRPLAASLRELDQLNRHLAERALRCLQAYTQTVTPSGQAYTRAGSRSLEAIATQSQRA